MTDAPAVTINLPGYPFTNLLAVDTIALLRARGSTGNVEDQNVVVNGGSADGDGGGGLFAWSALSVATDDGVKVIKPSDVGALAAGRWLLVGTDTALRADLAASGGAALVGVLPSGTGAVQRTVASVISDHVSLLDFIPVNLHAAIRARTSTTDITAYLQAAIDRIAAGAVGSYYGGTIYCPPGKYRVGSKVNMVKGLNLIGDGMLATTFEYSNVGTTLDDGTFLKMAVAVNTPTPSHIRLAAFSILHTSPATAKGAGIWDVCGTEWSVDRVSTFGFKYGVILDQSECADIDLCSFNSANHSGVWLTNGPDATAGASDSFTNRISINRGQFNGNGLFGILDDGGASHAFRDNNFNGHGTSSIRISCVATGLIEGGEYEGANNHVQVRAATLSGLVSGGNRPIKICSTSMAAGGSVPGALIDMFGAVGAVVVRDNYFSNGAQLCVKGVAGASSFYSAGNDRNGAGLYFDAEAQAQHVFLEGQVRGSATYNPPSIANGAQTTTTVTVTGISLGDYVLDLSFSNSLQGLVLTAYVSAADTVTCVFSNATGGAVDLASGTLAVRVQRRSL